jgi:anti-anti-sigma factor
LSGLFVAVLTILTLLLLTGLFEQLPEATLAAVVIAAVIELVDVRALAELYRVYAGRLGGFRDVTARPDFIAAIAAMLGVLVFDTLPGLFIGIAVSLTLLLYRASRPHVAMLGEVPGGAGQWGDVARHPENRQRQSVVVVRVESGLFFANADAVRAQLQQAASPPGVHTIVLDAESVPFIDVTAVRMLDELADELERRGVRLLIAREVGDVRDIFRRGGKGPELARVFPSVQAAVEAASAVGDDDPQHQ